MDEAQKSSMTNTGPTDSIYTRTMKESTGLNVMPTIVHQSIIARCVGTGSVQGGRQGTHPARAGAVRGGDSSDDGICGAGFLQGG